MNIDYQFESLGPMLRYVLLVFLWKKTSVDVTKTNENSTFDRLCDISLTPAEPLEPIFGFYKESVCSGLSGCSKSTSKIRSFQAVESFFPSYDSVDLRCRKDSS